jgi:hypothetical protein
MKIEPLEARIAPAIVSGVLPVATLDTSRGATFTGTAFNGFVGGALASAGDVNGDGFADFIIGLPTANGGAGGAKVFFGKGDSFALANEITAGTATPGGFEIVGENAGDNAGAAVAAAGDVNGDGFGDIVIGAPGAAGQTGAVYVLYGKADPFSATVPLAGLNENTGFRFTPGTDKDLGTSVSGAGDLNGDGFADVIAGAPGADGGAAWIIYGKPAGPVSSLQLTRLPGGQPGDEAGRSVSGVGDYNGDGFDDVIIGVPKFLSQRGAAFVVFGQKSGIISEPVTFLNASKGALILGAAQGDQAGFAVSGAGDVNGDGLADVIVGAPVHDSERGTAHLVFGNRDAVFNTNLETLGSTQGFTLVGPTGGEALGASVSGAGDVNGDGFADVLIGAPRHSNSAQNLHEGSAYVIFGHAGSFAALPDLNGLDGTQGFRIAGKTGDDVAGAVVRRAGDVNGDGFTDILIGAAGQNSNRGEAYLIYGAPSGHLIAPTKIVNNVATYTDVDGDLVTVTVTGTKATLAANNFTLLAKTNTSSNAQLLELALGAEFDGANVSITAKRAGGGDGKVNVGFLNAPAADLGTVAIAGDLVHFSVGDEFPDIGLKSLTLDSMGLFSGLTGNGGNQVVSDVEGGLGTLKITGDLRQGDILVKATNGTANANLGSATIGGSMGNAVFASSLNAASMGTVTIGGDVQKASIQTTSLAGGIAGVTIGGSVMEGNIFALTLPNVTIGGDVIGGTSANGGLIFGGTVGNVTIGGSLIRKAASGFTGAIFANSIGNVKIAQDLIGGLITTQAGKIASVTIGGDARSVGSIFGVFSTGQLGPVVVKGDVVATTGAPFLISSGFASPAGKTPAIASVSIGGKFEHGIIAGTATNAVAPIGSITVGGDWIASSVAGGVTLSESAGTGPVPRLGSGGDTLAPVNPGSGVASIASVTIKGSVRGTFETGDRYGIVAEQIGSVSIGGQSLVLKTGPGNDLSAIAVGATPDFVVRELSRTTPSPAAPAFTFPTPGPKWSQPASIGLGTLTGSDGFGLAGTALSDGAGVFVKGAGDVNGDGFADVIVGAPAASQNPNDVRGAAYVVFGKAGGFDPNLSLAALDGTNGFRIVGAAPGDQLGAVSGAGDVNGDGLADVIVGASLADQSPNDSRGAAYIIFGKRSYVQSATPGFTFALAALNSADGITLLGARDGDNTGFAVSGAGDVNGDGLGDVIVGAPATAQSPAGRAYIVFGRHDLVRTIPLDALDGLSGVRFSTNSGQVGDSVGAAGDVNGDGFGDVIIGGRTTNSAFVVFGKSSFASVSTPGVEFVLTDLNGLDGFQLTGVNPDDRAGGSVSGAGDVNGDGLADLIVGAARAEEAGQPVNDNNGAAYVIFGKTAFASTATPGFALALGSLNGSDGFRLTGVATGDGLSSVGAAGDVNGDGFADLIVGATGADTFAGAAYVVFGHPGNFPTALALSALDGANGFKIAAAAPFDLAGIAVHGAGDVNGDGFADVIVGATDAAGAVGGSGAAYVVFGGPTGEFIFPNIALDGKTATYPDVDGDLVTAKISGSTAQFTGNYFKLLAKSAAPGAPAQLLELDLGAKFDGAAISITVTKRAPGGDGKVNVGYLKVTGADLGAVTIGGDLGRLDVGDGNIDPALKSLTIGSLGVFGGRTQGTGGLLLSQVKGPTGAVNIAGDVDGAQFLVDGVFPGGGNPGVPGSIASVSLGGSLFGGTKNLGVTLAAMGSVGPGTIGATGPIGAVKIGGDIVGGAASFSGYLRGTGIASLTLGGSLLGGAGAASGFVNSVISTFGSVTVSGDQIGGSGLGSGSIVASAGASLGAVNIKGDQIGAGLSSALISATGAGGIGSVTIGGHAQGGTKPFSGGILAGGTLGPVNIKGSVTGTAEAAYIIRGIGPLTGTKSVAITSLTVGGNFDHALVLAGYGDDNTPLNGHAQIGAITIGRDWIASSVTAGLLPQLGATNAIGAFGEGDDKFIALPAAPALNGVVASIASITIKGRAIGSLETGDRFGIVAEQIGSLSVGGIARTLVTGKSNDLAGFAFGPTPDFLVREVARV